MTGTHPSLFGALLRHHRAAFRLTQEELAERAGISLRGLVALENGERLRPHRDTIQLLADALQLSGDARARFEAAARGRNGRDAGSSSSPATAAGHPLLRWATEAAPTTVPSVPLVGRADEVELIERHLASDGAPMLVLSGEPGIGKTRLLRQAADIAARDGWTVITGGCYRRSGQEPYAPFPQAVAQYLATVPVHALQLMVDDNRWLVSLLPELAQLLPEPPPSSPSADGQERRLLFDAVARLLVTVGGSSGTVLLLDDLQWAPTDSLDLLDALVRGPVGSRLRVVSAYRTTEVQPQHALTFTLADLAHAGLVQRRLIQPLGSDDSERLFATLVSDVDLQGAAVQGAVARSGGVPFYLVSYAQEMQLTTVAARGDVPWSVAQSLRQRVALLSPLTQEILAIAAVAGRTMPRVLLESVTDRQEWEILAAVEEACGARLLEESGSNDFRFPHDVIRESIEADLGAARRALLHRQIGETLEQLPARRRAGSAEVAWHFLEGQDVERALRYNLLAGDEAAGVFAYREAEQHYHVALGLAREVGDDVREGEILEKLGWILWTVGRYDEALHALESAAEGQRRAGNGDAEGRVVAKIGWALSQQGKPAEGIVRLKSVAERLEARGPSPSLVALYTTLVHLYVRQGRRWDVAAAAQRAADLSRAVDDGRTRVQGEFNRALALISHDRLEDALRVLEEVVQAAEREGDSETQCRALDFAGRTYTERGEIDRGVTYMESLVRLRERTGSPDRVAAALARLGNVLVVQGDWAEARGSYERAAALTSALSSHQAGWVRLSLAELCLLEGRWRDADWYLDQSAGVLERTGERASVPRLQALLAQRDLLEGRAMDVLARLEPLKREVDLEDDALMVLAEGYLAVGNVARADELVRERLLRAVGRSGRLAQADWLRLQAEVLEAQGRLHDADHNLAEAVSLAAEMSYPFARARALHAWGRLHLRYGRLEEARERLDEALHIFQRLGAHPFIEETEQSLRSLAHGSPIGG